MAYDRMTYPCGHPRSPENSKRHGNGQACRTCRQDIERRSQAKIRATKVSEQELARSGHNSLAPLLIELTEDDIAEKLAKECAAYSRKCDTGLTAWCKHCGVNKNHASEFVNRKRKPCNDLLKALGVRMAYVTP